MRTVLVDDDALMLESFSLISKGITELEIAAKFQRPEDAISYAKKNNFELALLDICMPKMSGIQLAIELRKIHPEILIVFVSAHDKYLRDFNQIGGDYYIVKPYSKETIEMMVKKMQLLSQRLQSDVYIQMFGRFNVLKNGVPIKLSGKAKEILALVACRCGKEISNEEIYRTIWEEREYSNNNMKVYYNALARLKKTLAEQNLSILLFSTPHGQMLNANICKCDYFVWKESSSEIRVGFEGEFLSEYSWGENILAEIWRVEYPF